MKNFKTTLVAAAVSSLLFGCSGDDYDLPVKENNVAPTVNGNINITVGEKDIFQFVDLLAGAVDLDGDFLSVENISPSIAEINAMLGVDIDGNQLLLRPSELIDSLNTGDTETMVFTFDVSDGTLSTPRTATINITGEDFAPVIAEGRPLSGSFIKDVSLEESTLDALQDITDADGDDLTTGNLVVGENNPYDLVVSLENNQLVVDVSSVADLIPSGQLTEFNFTYDIMDGNNTVSRNIEIGVLGVSDLPGAPDIENYFPSSNFEEDSGVQTIDLLEGISDEEGNEIQVSSITVDGVVGYDVGISVENTTLSFDTAAFIHHARNGGTGIVEIAFNVEDDQGNQSDGRVVHTVTLTDKNLNLLVDLDRDGNGELDVDYNFEAQRALPDFFGTGEVTGDAARTGRFGLALDSTDSGQDGFIFNLPSLAANSSYYVSLWVKRTNTAANIHYNAQSSAAGRAWWSGGERVSTETTDVWEEIYFNISTAEGTVIPSGQIGRVLPEFVDINDAVFSILDGPSGDETNSVSFFDDIRFVDYTIETTKDFDVIAGDMGSFEDALAVPGTSEEGAVEILTGIGVDGTNGLRVSTDASTVMVSIPLIGKSVRADGRYRLSMNVNSFEAGAEGNVRYAAYLKTASGQSLPTYFTEFGNWARDVSVMINLDESAQIDSPNWVDEDVTLVIEVPSSNVAGDATGLNYNFDNVTLDVAR